MGTFRRSDGHISYCSLELYKFAKSSGKIDISTTEHIFISANEQKNVKLN